jgi:VCBS repeat-containing protein
VLNTNGTYTYTPAANYNGTDSFTYKVNDGVADSNIVTVSFSLSAVNDAPVVIVSSTTPGLEDTILNGSLASTASDVDGNPLTFIKLSDPIHGTLTFNSNGTYTYKPVANYNGTDSFTYQVNDGTMDSNIATLNLNMAAVNDAPVVTAPAAANGTEDTAISGNLSTTASDIEGNALSFLKVKGPNHGTLVLNTNGTYTYKPAANYNGSDSFTYKANDAKADSNVVTVSLTLAAVNDPPVAQDMLVEIDKDQMKVTQFLAASDVDGDKLSYEIISQPKDGEIKLLSDGSFTYERDKTFGQQDQFTYQVQDAKTTSAVKTVIIQIKKKTESKLKYPWASNISGLTSFLIASINSYVELRKSSHPAETEDEELSGLIQFPRSFSRAAKKSSRVWVSSQTKPLLILPQVTPQKQEKSEAPESNPEPETKATAALHGFNPALLNPWTITSLYKITTPKNSDVKPSKTLHKLRKFLEMKVLGKKKNPLSFPVLDQTHPQKAAAAESASSSSQEK